MAEQGKRPVKPADGAPATGAASETPADETTSLSAEAASLLGLIDKLSSLLERSDLVELEVEAGESGIVLRKPAALLPAVAAHAAAGPAAASSLSDPAAAAAAGELAAPVSAARAVRAPLTGIFYSASSPSAPPYVTVGQHVAVGQIIGLIEAMKLFNEIKSDASGRVVRIVAESGKLVKAKQPLLEVEP
jgi:acetyl-CoA carboxylase biotin carboxyl carrier protein